jgi:ABC-2 type transport system ATP-binding protein
MSDAADSPLAPLQLHEVRKYYGPSTAALDGVDWSVPAGSVVGLLGQNAAGKTTLIKTALGLIRPTRGEAKIFGENAWDLSAAAKARIGYVPQVVTLYPSRAAIDQLHGVVLPALER